MTKEEYMHLTAYTSIEQARQDLNMIRSLFVVVAVAILLSDFIITFLIAYNENFGIFLYVGYLILLGFFVWRCYDIKKKTKQVNKASLLFSILLAPISWIWFYPQLTEPLEIIVGNRQPPTNVQSMAEREALIKKGNRNTVRTILMVAVFVFAFLWVMYFLQQSKMY